MKGIRRSCEKRIAGLDLPAGLGVHGLVELISRRRGRPITLIPLQVPAAAAGDGAAACGWYVQTVHHDIIGFDRSASPLHRGHIVLHELAHLLCDHRADQPLDDRLVRSLFPDLDPTVVQAMLGRGAYSDRDEAEAEMLASLLAAKVMARASRPRPPARSDAVRRLESALQGRLR